MAGRTTWSPDGRKLAFQRQRLGTTGEHVYVMLANGSDSHRVSAGAVLVSTPLVWSPDGTRLAWSVGYNLGSLLIARADGSGAPTKLMQGFVDGWKRTAIRPS